MLKNCLLLATILLMICYKSSAIIDCVPKISSNLIESNSYANQEPFDSISICYKPCYDEIMKFLLHDPAAKAGFSFLTNKKINNHYKLNIKVSNRVYPIAFLKNDTICQMQKTFALNDCFEYEKFELSSYSTAAKKYKFIIFFSAWNNNTIECKIVSASGKKTDEDIYVKTRFGKVATIRFCMNFHTIGSYKITLSSP